MSDSDKHESERQQKGRPVIQSDKNVTGELTKVQPLFGLDAAPPGRTPAPAPAPARDKEGKSLPAGRNVYPARVPERVPERLNPNRGQAVAQRSNGGPMSARRIEQQLTVISPKKVPFTDPSQLKFVLPPLPAPIAKRSYGIYASFAICVLVPILIATAYFGFIASSEYEAEFRFAVQDSSSSSPSSAAGGLLALVGGSGGGSSNNYLVADFLTSREAVEAMQKQFNVTSLYSKPDIDWLSRFNPSLPMEKFVSYWQKMVTAHYDQVTGIADAKVVAFSANDALTIANGLVTLSEDLVNRIANRSQTDAVHFAQKEVTLAENRLKAIKARLTDYRNRTGVIDPNLSVAASNATLIQTQRANLSQLETQVATLLRQNLQPSAPIIVGLQNQINATKQQLQSTESMVGNSYGGIAGLSTVMAEYEQLDLERQFAQTMMTGTMQALDQARMNATSQHLYITPYVKPSLPESAIYPRRLLSVGMVGALAFVAWVMGLLIFRSIHERFA